MKPELKRIEAALQQAAEQYRADLVASGHSNAPESPSDTRHSNHFSAIHGVETATSTGSVKHSSVSTIDLHSILRHDSGSADCVKEPSLPGFTASQESNGFVALTNSALAINLLKDLQTMVGEWVTALEGVIQQIQALYEEGPIVDGWLESVNSQEAGVDYQPINSMSYRTLNTQPLDSSQTTYRLCGLHDDGQIWCHPCPQEQVPDISWAIVRYQRLRNLLARKNSLEAQLGMLTETLVDVHGKIANTNE